MRCQFYRKEVSRMRKALLALAAAAVFALALAGPVGQFVHPTTPVGQHAEVIIDPPGGG